MQAKLRRRPPFCFYVSFNQRFTIQYQVFQERVRWRWRTNLHIFANKMEHFKGKRDIQASLFHLTVTSITFNFNREFFLFSFKICFPLYFTLAQQLIFIGFLKIIASLNDFKWFMALWDLVSDFPTGPRNKWPCYSKQVLNRNTWILWR